MDIRKTAKQVADILGFTTTNLKHYASLLEQNGHTLHRNTRNHREYTAHDIKLLRAMQTLNREKSMLLEDAASLVVSSDTDIDAILAPKMTEVAATIDANTIEVPQVSVDSEQLLSLVLALQSELYERDAIHTELLATIDDKLRVQCDVNNQLMAQNEALHAKLDALERKYEENSHRSVWAKLFGK